MAAVARTAPIVRERVRVIGIVRFIPSPVLVAAEEFTVHKMCAVDPAEVLPIAPRLGADVAAGNAVDVSEQTSSKSREQETRALT